MIFTLKPNISSETSAQVLEGRSVPLNKYRGQLFLIKHNIIIVFFSRVS